LKQESPVKPVLRLTVRVSNDRAFTNWNKAQQRLQKVRNSGFYNSGIFWIPDYANLSGKRYYVVYVDKFNNRNACGKLLNRYARNNSQAYCVFGSSDYSADPDRFKAGYIRFKVD
jgi:serine/threonine protein kinase, bacterial